uniref:hypothetical protein n=1 Tax=Agathobacter sp. TaxID=2021311 RepID=UPI0040575503
MMKKFLGNTFAVLTLTLTLVTSGEVMPLSDAPVLDNFTDYSLDTLSDAPVLDNFTDYSLDTLSDAPVLDNFTDYSL